MHKKYEFLFLYSTLIYTDFVRVIKSINEIKYALIFTIHH